MIVFAPVLKLVVRIRPGKFRRRRKLRLPPFPWIGVFWSGQ